jgi:hypothetical protein
MYTTSAATKELTFPGDISNGASGMRVKRVQEWVSFHGFKTTIDSGYGSATTAQVKAFQKKAGLTQTGIVNKNTWDKLVQPMDDLLNKTVTAGSSLDAAILKLANAHLKVRPVEQGGDNCGPWVRMYMDGNEGPAWRWCAGFVTFVVKQACHLTGLPMPIQGSFSCDSLAAQARTKKRFVTGASIASGAVPWSGLGACQIFLVRRTTTDWTHTGFSFNGSGDLFATIEGNTNDEGSSNGYEVCERQRSNSKKDFVRLI